MNSVVFVFLFALLAYSTLGSLTLFVLAVLHLAKWPKLQKNSPASSGLRFAVVVPAHNEQQCLGDTLAAIATMDYPAELFQTVVVADNCDDATAQVARNAGVRVMERRDTLLRGKGYALRLAFDAVLAEPFDAVVVIDADTRPMANLLKEFAAALSNGREVVQCRYGADNPDASSLSWLLVLGNVLENDFYHEPRARLGLPTILRGNGMCFAAQVLRENPWQAYSITEDTEYGILLLERGIEVAYLPATGVTTRLPETFEQLKTQRERWAAGNAAIARTRVPGLISRAVKTGDWRLADAAWSLLVSSKPQLIGCAFLASLIALIMQQGAFVAWGAGVLTLHGILLALGVRAMKSLDSSLSALLHLPGVLWFLTRTLAKGCLSRTQKAWMRTGRS
ncbi:MAG: glycosyltransferase family 2 protein [Acidobacteriota bacterium]